MKPLPLAILLSALQFANCCHSAEADSVFKPMPPRPTDPAAIEAQQSAATRKLEATLAKFEATHAGSITLERVRFPTVDGHQAPAYLFRAAGIDRTQKHPGWVFVRESAHGQFEVSYFPLVEEAIRRGYVVICPEIRGSIGYGLAYYRDIDIAGKEVDDVLSATDYLVDHESSVDPHRLAVMGISHGGMMVLYALEKAPKRFRVGVDIVGPTNLTAYLARRTQAADRAEFYGQPSLAGAEQDPSILVEKSPIAHVDRIRAPLLVMAVTNDNYTPLNLHAAPLIAALNAAGITHEYQLFRDAPGGHMFFTGDSRVAHQAVRDAFDYMDRAL